MNDIPRRSAQRKPAPRLQNYERLLRYRVKRPRLVAVRPKPITMLGDEVLQRVANAFGFTPDELKGPRRQRPLVRARWVIYLILKRAGWSYPKIGRLVGDRDHTTIMHGVTEGEKIEDVRAAAERLAKFDVVR